MPRTSKKYIAILALLFSIVQIECKCVQSYATLCDHVSDIEDYEHESDQWTDIIVGDTKASNLSSVGLMIGFYKLKSLRTLTILNRINEIKVTFGYQCTFANHPLEELNIYGNLIKTLTSYSFPVLRYKKLSLRNNQIENVVSDAFFAHHIETIDLSNNLIEVIETGIFSTLGGATKEILLNHNKIQHIEDGSFPNTLELLSLDHNNMRILQEGVLKNLHELKALSAKFNHFKTPAATMGGLTKLIAIDLSNNQITTISDDLLENLTNVTSLDLSNNKIANLDFLKSFLKPDRKKSVVISLAFNMLSYINLTGISLDKHKILLYGNPLDCDGWELVQKQVQPHQQYCDLKFFNGGTAPYCVDYKQFSHSFVSERVLDVQYFLDTIKISEKSVEGCSLALSIKSALIKNIEFGCVA